MAMVEIKAPFDYSAHHGKMPSVFLAGTIDMGISEDWQNKIAVALANENILILNPRREAWDSSWEQKIDNAPFREQVEWELDALDAADKIVMYFAPGSKSPVTMLELGIQAAANPEKLIVCCPEGFWRKGNVDIVCKRYGVRQIDDINELIAALKA